MKRRRFLVALGANDVPEGKSRVGILRDAIDFLERECGQSASCSRWYSTPAFPAGNGPDFVNSTLAIYAEMAPDQFLGILHRIEQVLGRERKIRWGARAVDLDLIGVDDLVLPDVAEQTRWRDLPLARQMKEAPSELILPHPRMQDRAFVLVPLADIAPDWMHPVLGLTVTQMCQMLPPQDLAEVRPLAESA